jgi:bifunctional enzyme CysN/CysC
MQPPAGREAMDRLRLVVVGHVDHGKSTLIGRLLLDTGSFLEGKYEQLAASATRRGVPFELANLTDALQAERDQNVTIDTAQIWFRREHREFVLIDAPGHREFVRNMVTGAATADAALLVVDAGEGVQEQSRRHGYLLKLLGVTQVAVVVNKLDCVNYSAAEFERTAAACVEFLSRVGVKPLASVPVSAVHGDNVARRSVNMPWYNGPLVVDVLDSFQAPIADAHAPLRLPIQDVYRFDARRVIVGRVESGTVAVGDRLLFLPSGKQSGVKTIERWNAEDDVAAVAGDAIGFTLTEQLFLARGEIASRLHDAPTHTREFTARLFWLGRRPLVKGRRYTCKLATQEWEGEIVHIANVVDASTLQPTGAADAVTADCVADVTIRSQDSIVVDLFTLVPALGRFVIVDELDVCGGGIVLSSVDSDATIAAPASANIVRSVGQVSREERHARQGHKGAVVWFTGLSGAGKTTLAYGMERELFNAGSRTFVLDGDNLRFGLTADLGFSAADRSENIRRVAEVARLFAQAGVVVITAFISPYHADRERARRIVEQDGAEVPFIEVYVSTPLAVCEARDPKRLYAKARSGEIQEFTGISAPFEIPQHPDVIIDASVVSPAEAIAVLTDHVAPRIGHRRRGSADARD